MRKLWLCQDFLTFLHLLSSFTQIAKATSEQEMFGMTEETL